MLKLYDRYLGMSVRPFELLLAELGPQLRQFRSPRCSSLKRRPSVCLRLPVLEIAGLYAFYLTAVLVARTVELSKAESNQC